MVKYLFILFLGLSSYSFTQLLDNRMGEAFTDKPFFNSDFVRQNKLKRLTGSFVYMKNGEPMRSTEFKYVYEFNENGTLQSTFETRTDDGSTDTTWNFYEYDDSSRLIKHRKTDLDGFHTTLYTYDSLGRLVGEEILREIDSNGVIVRTLSFSKERYSYRNSGDQILRTRYNNYDLPYLEEYFSYNDEGYLVERIERIKMTSAVYTYHYLYNEKGLLSSIKKSGNKDENYLEEWDFKYDEYGNLIEKHLTRKGIFTTDIQIVYNSKTKLVSSVITRQVSTNFRLILRFLDYEFFE